MEDGAMSLPLLTGPFFQVGYVVRDLEKAVAAMRSRTGVRNWRVTHLPEGNLIEGAAFAWSKGLMLELIEVDPDNIKLPVYKDHIPEADDVARLHHLGFIFDTEAEYLARIAESQAQGFGAAMDMNYNEILAYYSDTYAQLGHFCEFVHLRPAARDFFIDVPHN
jgi:hypothetical protein